jgi:hypothetical protein
MKRSNESAPVEVSPQPKRSARLLSLIPRPTPAAVEKLADEDSIAKPSDEAVEQAVQSL